jgi:hypothetical protein
VTLQSQLAALITAIGSDVKSLQGLLNLQSITLPVQSSVATPGAGSTVIYSKQNLSWYTKNELGFEVSLTDPLHSGRGYIIPRAGAATLDYVGATTLSATGTLTLANPATTNKHTRLRRAEFLVTVAATTAVAGYRPAAAHLLRGNAAGVGGFYVNQVWGPATGVATSTYRAFCGIAASTSAPTDVNPSTQVSCIGMGWDSGDANVQLMYNDASGTATKVSLGASFLRPTVDRTSVYRIELWCGPNASKISYRITDLVSGAVASGDTGVSTDIPANTTLLAERAYCSVGGTSAVVGLSLYGITYEHETIG